MRLHEKNNRDMERLLNIEREGGFPLCAQTLQVLNDNSEMFSQWLKAIPLKNRQAVAFGEHMLVCQNLQKRWVKRGTMTAASISQCKLVFSTVVNPVNIGLNNAIPDVWETETADIVDETSPGAQWTILGLSQVFELGLWYDNLPSLEAVLPSSSVSHGSIVSLPALHGQDNVLRSNSNRLQIHIALAYTLYARNTSVLSIPLPCECPDGTRMEADLEVVSTGKHYPVRAYVESGALLIDIGRWLTDENLYEGFDPHFGKLCNDIIRINKEVVL